MTPNMAGPLAREAALLAAALRDMLVDPTLHGGAAGHRATGGTDATGSTDGVGSDPHAAAAGLDGEPLSDRVAGSGCGSGAHNGSSDGHQDNRSGGVSIAVCQVCPVCRLVAMLAAGRPEVTAHLFAAATSLTAALRAILAGPASDVTEGADGHDGTDRQAGTTERPRPRSRVQRIDVE
ncbi:hypothetical protein [Frankia sp. Cas3]|uniref:hypothetical protein n=1 Tax=Frankia sp. Cas3 TaxID=3073926 RepID=UPI002AD32AC9|nr:hypothetical protein [Frankia sp. Cas3]